MYNVTWFSIFKGFYGFKSLGYNTNTSERAYSTYISKRRGDVKMP